MRPWHATEIAKRHAASAINMEFDEAVSALVVACFVSAVVAPERVVHAWFPEASSAVDQLLASGEVLRVAGRPPLLALRRFVSSHCTY
jgi:hypothetical protein